MSSQGHAQIRGLRLVVASWYLSSVPLLIPLRDNVRRSPVRTKVGLPDPEASPSIEACHMLDRAPL